MRSLVVGFAALALIASGCSRFTGRSRSAVRAAIEQHLREQPGLQMQNMTMEVRDVRFKGDTADAQVRFVSKGSAEAFVVIRYQLRRDGGHWQVRSTSRENMGGGPHEQISGGSPASSPHRQSPVEGPMGPVPQPAPQPSH
jgi:hypothetical protein